MAKLNLKEKAVALRKGGFSYNEILTQVPVAKSTLSLWLREFALSRPQRQRLTEKKLLAIQKGWETIRRNKINRVSDIKNRARTEVSQKIVDPMWLMGVILYWGEGSKEHAWSKQSKLAFTNMDAQMHQIFIKWLLKYGAVKKEDLRYELYIHPSGNLERAKSFWYQKLDVPANSLRVYFKKNNPKTTRKRVNDNYFGTVRTWVIRSSALQRTIAGWIEGVVVYANR